ncbi:MAG: dihydroorotase [Calditrichaeota bacterium]|nr:MAG: dihydroorotase [Calditrichota bacterium]
MQNFKLISPLDMHLHLREGEMLETVAPLSAETFAGAVIMPNLITPVDSENRLLEYEKAVREAIRPHTFEPFMTLFFKKYDRDFLQRVKDKIIGIKLYPAGITTNSESGIKSIEEAAPTFSAMQELKIPLLVHGETDGFVMERESEFIAIYRKLAQTYPRLKIVMEHITTQAAVDFLDRYENIFATVTLQHVLITLDDVAGGLLRPHLFCKPIAKRPEDRDALLQAALHAHPKLMFGSDSAPHPIDKKESCGCAAGVFTAPIALQVLVGLFEKHGCLDNLQNFISNNAQKIYGIVPPHKVIHFKKENYTVPQKIGEVVPMFASEELAWSVDNFQH